MLWKQNKAVSHPTAAMMLPSIRKNAMLPGMQKLKSLPWLQGGVQSQGLGSGAGNGVDAGLLPDRNQPPKKTKPPKTISKQMTGCISQCSSTMTEILSWQAKLAENKTGLILAKKKTFFILYLNPKGCTYLLIILTTSLIP